MLFTNKDENSVTKGQSEKSTQKQTESREHIEQVEYKKSEKQENITMQPTQPTQPTQLIKPIQQTQQTQLIKPIKSIQPTQPTQPTQQIQSIQPIDSIINNNINVKFDKETTSFIFYTLSFTIGSFTCKEFLKYIFTSMSSPEVFLGEVTITNIAEKIIKHYVCNIEPDNNFNIINFRNHLISPFTGDLQLLFTLYKHISLFEKNLLNNELQKLNIIEKNKIKTLFLYINCSFLTHILKIISLVCSNNIKIEIREELEKYSKNAIVKLYSILEFLYEAEIKKNNEFISEYVKIEKERNSVLLKLNKMEEYMMVNQLNILKGGDDSSDNNDNDISHLRI
jgi:hypothetical protein